MAVPRWRQVALPARPAAAFAVANATAAAIALAVSGSSAGAPAAAGSATPAPVTGTRSSTTTQPARTPATSTASTRPTPSRSAVPAAPSALAADGIPTVALRAYRTAARAEAARDPACHLPWPLLAAIGRVESNHGRFAGAQLQADGHSTPPIIGVPLDGHGVAFVKDTDQGRLDGDTVHDRAVGPMQFIPATWAAWGRDADHDGRRDPFDLDDAAAAAADYLCAAGGDLATYSGQATAVGSYNHSSAYLNSVLGVEQIYAATFGVAIPAIPADPSGHRPAHRGGPTLPPVDPGPPRALTPPTRPNSPRTTPVSASTSATTTPGAATSSSTTSPAASAPPSTDDSTTETTPAPTDSTTEPPIDPTPTDSPTGESG